MVSPAYRQAPAMVSTANRQVQLPSGRFTACWPIGLGSYNGAPAVFLSNKRRILDPREEVFPIPIDKEAVPLLSEASECTRPNNTWMGGGSLRYRGKLFTCSSCCVQTRPVKGGVSTSGGRCSETSDHMLHMAMIIFRMQITRNRSHWLDVALATPTT